MLTAIILILPLMDAPRRVNIDVKIIVGRSASRNFIDKKIEIIICVGESTLQIRTQVVFERRYLFDF